jgi:hypothetical protein
MSQWLAIAFSTWYTWLIYVSNTSAGTEAQADLVPWITWGLFAISLNSLRMDDEFLVHLPPKTHWIKAGADINIVAQVFLLVVTGHWILALVRGFSEALIRFQVDKASEWLWIEPRQR